MSLLWLDLETTGLKADKESVLEVACIITDDQLNEVARLQRVVYYKHAARIVELLDQRVHYRYRDPMTTDVVEHEKPDYRQLHQHYPDIGHIDPYVLEMHDKNGLWRDCIHGQALDTVDRDLAAFVTKHGITTEEYVDKKGGETKTRPVTPQLAGSTISFDRAFINAHLPRLADEKVLHYRNCDVSTFNETAKRFWKPVFNARPNAGRAKEDAAHRGMADIEESIEVYKHYLANVTPRVTAIEAP